MKLWGHTHIIHAFISGNEKKKPVKTNELNEWIIEWMNEWFGISKHDCCFFFHMWNKHLHQYQMKMIFKCSHNGCLQSHKLIIIEGLFESTNYSIDIQLKSFLGISSFQVVFHCNCNIRISHALARISRHRRSTSMAN